MFLFSLILLTCACDLSGSSAKNTLNKVAEALDKNDISTFIDQFDIKACAVSEIKNVTESNEALSTLDHLGRTLGLGGMEDLIGNVFDVENSLRQNFRKKVSSGVLQNECSRQDKPGCPWVSKSLRNAETHTVSDTAAVARVKTPASVTTWIALRKKGKEWRIVGWADMEEVARSFAVRESLAPEEEKTKTSPKEKEKKSPKREESGKPGITL